MLFCKKIYCKIICVSIFRGIEMAFLLVNCMAKDGDIVKTLLNIEKIEQIYEVPHNNDVGCMINYPDGCVKIEESIDEIIKKIGCINYMN